MQVVTGNAEGVKKSLEACEPDEKVALLETRYTILRLSPIFFAIIGMSQLRIVNGSAKPSYREVMKLLLEHGARYQARELTGKTLLHYIMGPLCFEGNSEMLEMADMCIQKAKADGMSPALVNVQDRFGGVCLLQVIMMIRVDLVTFLCTKHKADPRIADNDGAVPTRMVELIPGLRNIILPSANKLAANEFRRTHKSELECHCCGKSDVEKLLNCSRCRIAKYCNPACQKAHWKTAHKKECVQGIIITNPPKTDQVHYNVLSGQRFTHWNGNSPPGVPQGEFFYVKIQIAQRGMPFILYDKTRTGCYIQVTTKQCTEHDQLYDLISSFQPGSGRKAYFRAKVDEPGKLFISTAMMFSRTW